MGRQLVYIYGVENIAIGLLPPNQQVHVSCVEMCSRVATWSTSLRCGIDKAGGAKTGETGGARECGSACFQVPGSRSSQPKRHHNTTHNNTKGRILELEELPFRPIHDNKALPPPPSPTRHPRESQYRLIYELLIVSIQPMDPSP